MRNPTCLILLSLCLFGNLPRAFAQDPTDFFDYKAERQFRDSLYEHNPDLSREELRQAMEAYYRQRADANYQVYQRRMAQQKIQKKLPKGQLQSQIILPGTTINNTTSEGLVPDAVEYAALVAFYNATGGENWNYNESWLQGNTSADFANWYGVEVENGDVVGLYFEFRNLVGAVPPEIGDLSALRFIGFRGASITSLPSRVGELSNLEDIYMSSTLLETIPEEIGALTNLRGITVSHSVLNVIPSTIGNLTSVQHLSLLGNSLSYLPTELGNLTSLNYLDLGGNQLTELPAELGNLTNLDYLDLGGNQLTELPSTLGNLSSLKYFGAYYNLLTELPEEISGLISLEDLVLDYNQLNSLPSGIGSLSSLMYVQIRNNQLTSLPPEIGDCRRLEQLSFERNLLANLPTEMASLHNLRYLNVYDNKLSSFPDLSSNPNKSSLYVSIANNQIIVDNLASHMHGPNTHPYGYFGYVPQSKVFGEPTSLNVIAGESITLQGFTDNHPQTRFQWQRLNGEDWTDIDGQTQETYSIASTALADAGQYRCRIINDWVSGITQYSAPVTLEVEVSNQVNQGKVPDAVEYAALMALYNATGGDEWTINENWGEGSSSSDWGFSWYGVQVKDGDVQAITLHNNNMIGSIPSEIGNLTGLTSLSLDQNQLSGPIPSEIGNLTNLLILHLWKNQLSGPVPKSLQRLSKLVALRLFDNEFTELPDLSGLPLYYFLVNNNRLTTISLLQNTSATIYRYAPQKEVGPPQDITLEDCYGQAVTLDFDQEVSTNHYEWYFNNQSIFITKANSFLAKPEQLAQDNLFGSWHVQITNPRLPDLTLRSRPINIHNGSTEPCAEDLSHNYVQTETVLTEGRKSEADLEYLSHQELNTSYSYIDGLGRAIQQVEQAASPAGYDVVQPIEYDALSRTTKSYLPYVANDQGGYYRSNATTAVENFYSASDDHVANTSFPYAETVYEASPLSRVTEQGAVGSAWQPTTPGAASNKTIKTAYRTNTTNEVRWWQLEATGIATNYFRQPGQLYVLETKDELNRAVLSFKDKRGLTVLKQVESDDGFLETYYIHDDFGNLRVVIPPKASATLANNGYDNFSFTSGFVRKGCYHYEYDVRQRMISQQVPGAEPVWMVYDQGDRLVLTQDGNQRPKKQWSFTKYDPLNRPILTGLFTTTGTLSQAQMQNNVADQHTTERYQGQQNNAPFGYSDASYPKASDGTVAVLTATYYDHYDFVSDLHGGNSYDFVDVSDTDPAADYPSAYFPRVQGQVTGTQVRVLGTDTWRWEAVYYDEDYRVIQTIGSHYPQGADRYTTRYDDAGRATHTLRQHYGYAGSHAVETVHRRYAYDHAGRPTAVYHRINNEAEVQLAANTYNELGELITQDLHRFQDEGYLQSVDYAYNERGWLTAINGLEPNEENDLFGLQLEYNTGPNPQYNGNIASAQWMNQTDPGETPGYAYAYDKLDRLAKADFSLAGGSTSAYDVHGATSGDPISYDASGNIRRLTRYGQQDTKIDELAYDYGSGVGNQLQSVTDGGNAQGFTAGEGGLDDDYYYDENGNLTDDYHKGITVHYNHLNLPERIDFTATGAQIRYTYDAAGTRLMKEVDFDGVNQQTLYMAGIEYYSPNWQNTPESQRLFSYLGTDYGRVYPYFPLDTDPCATLSSQTTNEGRRWVYHYDLTDHLGNVRTTVASERTTDRYVATMEDELKDKEALMFRGLDTRHPDGKYNTTTCDAIGELNESAHLRVASEMDQRVFGPAKMLPVQPGDKIKLSVMAQYVPSTNNQTYSANLATLFLSAFTGGGPGAIESGSAAYQGLSEALGAGALLGRDEGDVPRAYLRYILFDKNYQPVASFNDQNSMRISAAGANAAEQLASGEITIDQPGYLYVYVSNESNWATDVFFDDLVIEHERGTVVQAQDFYPFGMAHQPHTRYENKHLYQSKEWQHELALNWFDFHARQYDPALGRFNGIDPLASSWTGISPYNGMLNNPISYVDPDGRHPLLFMGAAMIVGAGTGGAIAANQGYGMRDPEFWRAVGAGAAIGVAVGAGAWYFSPAALGGHGGTLSSMFGGVGQGLAAAENFTAGPGILNPLTTQRLDELGRQRGHSRPLKTRQKFEQLALDYFDLSSNSQLFRSNARKFNTYPMRPRVRPDAVRSVRVRADGKTTTYPNSSFFEIKGVNGEVGLDYSDHQILGELDALRNTAGGKAGKGTMTFITTSNTTIGQDVINYATQNNISLFQSKAYEVFDTGKIGFSSPNKLNFTRTSLPFPDIRYWFKRPRLLPR